MTHSSLLSTNATTLNIHEVRRQSPTHLCDQISLLELTSCARLGQWLFLGCSYNAPHGLARQEVHLKPAVQHLRSIRFRVRQLAAVTLQCSKLNSKLPQARPDRRYGARHNASCFQVSSWKELTHVLFLQSALSVEAHLCEVLSTRLLHHTKTTKNENMR